MKGFFNQYLLVDLGKRSFQVVGLDDGLLKGYLGGKGLSTRLLLEHTSQGLDPLGPENCLIFSTGPASGTPVWGSCRYGVYTKSPQTGFYSESYSGGTVGDFITKTGFDAIVIKGRSREPLWLEITHEGAKFHSASGLWGLDTHEAEEEVKGVVRETNPSRPNSGVVVIGPAGENLVAFAVVENDKWRSAGRTGVGAVMGSKRIKAIAFWGSSKREIAEPGLVKAFSRQISERGKEDPGVKAYKSMGTPMLVKIMNQAGGFPTRYWQKGSFERWEKISAEALHQRCEVRPHACLKCFIACGRMTTVREGRHKGLRIEGPEYETIYAFGGLCEVDEIEEIIFLNDICDRLGMDTISSGNLVAFAIEASRRGKIALKLDYGDVDGIAKLLQEIAFRRGVGEVLAQGIRHAAKEWGMEEYAIHVKGLEPAGYDPRVLKGMGLAYGTSDRGACHLRATFYKPELSGMIDPDKIRGKAKMFVEWEDRLTIFDTLILCRFFRDMYQWEELATIIRGTIGLDLDREAMRAISANVTNATRTFNLREGLRPEDDRLPSRFHREAIGPGKVITQEEMAVLLREYYEARGWGEKGIPPQSTH